MCGFYMHANLISYMSPCALQDSGTTATVVVLCGSQLITANVGDSLAYADLGTRVQQLTSSHRIDENISEQRRIESSGMSPVRMVDHRYRIILCLSMLLAVSSAPRASARSVCRWGTGPGCSGWQTCGTHACLAWGSCVLKV